jgi:radical SAM superfamily enzyme YgiQ (UPF0313 family)
MKIAFVNDSCERLGVEYISAVLKQHGHTVKLFADPQLFNDENFTIAPLARFFDQQDELLAQVQAFQPDLVGFSVVTDFYQWACALARRIKTVMDVPVLFGGIHATSVPEKVLKQDCVDMVCRGEGELALLDLANSMEQGRMNYAIPNIWFTKNGRIIKNDVRPLIEDLDALPFPDKDLFYEASPHFSKCYFLMTNRGCAYACSYCCNSFLKKFYHSKGRYLRFRSAANVIAELELAKQKYGIKMVRIHDDDFLTHDVPWFEEFAEKYSTRIQAPFACFTHPNSVTEIKARLLKKAGCHDIEVGVQSISAETRSGVLNRNVSDEQLIRSLKILKDAGIKVVTDNILGLPHQGQEELLDLIKFYNKNRIMKIYCFGFRHYPATDIVEYSRNAGLLTDEDVDNLENGVNVKTFIQSGDILSREAKQLQTFFAFLLYLPEQINNYILEKKLYRFFIPLPYYILVIFSNWLRIPYRYNWALHITVCRYRVYTFKKIKNKLQLAFRRGHRGPHPIILKSVPGNPSH